MRADSVGLRAGRLLGGDREGIGAVRKDAAILGAGHADDAAELDRVVVRRTSRPIAERVRRRRRDPCRLTVTSAARASVNATLARSLTDLPFGLIVSAESVSGDSSGFGRAAGRGSHPRAPAALSVAKSRLVRCNASSRLARTGHLGPDPAEFTMPADVRLRAVTAADRGRLRSSVRTDSQSGGTAGFARVVAGAVGAGPGAQRQRATTEPGA